MGIPSDACACAAPQPKGSNLVSVVGTVGSTVGGDDPNSIYARTMGTNGMDRQILEMVHSSFKR